MELMKWRPARDRFNIPTRFGSLLNDFLVPARFGGDGEALWGWRPAVDMYENDDTIVVAAELPGVEKDHITVDLQGRMLTIKGDCNTEKEVKEDRYYRRERAYGHFERVLTLPAEVDPATIKAEFKDGVLRIEVPKPEARKAKRITVQ